MKQDELSITVNDERISYQLENENSVGQVFEGLVHWLSESELLVKSISIDGKSVLLTDMEWKTISLDTVKTINIEAVNLREGKLIQLGTLRDFFRLLDQCLSNEDFQLFGELSGGYWELRDILTGFFNTDIIEALISPIDQLFSQKSLNGKNDALVKNLKTIISLLESRCNELLCPEEHALKISHVLADMATKLDEVAINLQTGHDKNAMETIIRMTELLQSLLRCLEWVNINEDTVRLTDEINRILIELEEALKAQDTILIGDLLEYEMKTKLIELPGILHMTDEMAP